MFPKVRWQRGARYVEEGHVASAGGISSGIDPRCAWWSATRARRMCRRIVDAMEYQGTGWLDPMSNQTYAVLPSNDPAHPICPLCGMDADTNIRSTYKGDTYYFCAEGEKEFFDAHPEVMERFVVDILSARVRAQ